MTDNDSIRLLTPENDTCGRAFFSSREDLSKRVEKYATTASRRWTGNAIAPTRNPVKLEVSRRSFQNYRNNGILPYIQEGDEILYRASDIERALTGGYKETYRLKGNT